MGFAGAPAIEQPDIAAVALTADPVPASADPAIAMSEAVAVSEAIPAGMIADGQLGDGISIVEIAGGFAEEDIFVGTGRAIRGLVWAWRRAWPR